MLQYNSEVVGPKCMQKNVLMYGAVFCFTICLTLNGLLDL